MNGIQCENTAYVIGLAIGDGNLSNPNGRATRLRITCDNKYPLLKDRVVESLKILFSKNKISEYLRKENCSDIYCYSNHLESILGWKAMGGSKYSQQIGIPLWIFSKKEYIRKCLKGLFETDGSIYKDRKYIYVNFTTIIKNLMNDVNVMLEILGYKPNINKVMQKSGKYKYIVRICKRSIDLINEIELDKR